jgi:anti-anti-sigma factor
MFDITFKKRGRVTVATIRITQVVDPSVVHDMGEEIIAHLEDYKGSHLLLNFGRVEFLSSSLLSELLRINEIAKRHNGSIRICGLKPGMREIFAITKLEDLFTICEDCKTCLREYHTELSNGAGER